jgi:hypothetical protein
MDQRKKNIVPARYEIRIAGQLDQTAVAAFAGLKVTPCGSVTVVRGEFDQASLQGLLERIRSLGLDLIEARRVRGSPDNRAAVATASPWAGDPRRPNGSDHDSITAVFRKEAPVTGRAYEIRVVGSLGPAAREAFTDVAIEVEPTATVLCGDMDQAALHGLLDRVRALGLELVAVRQIPDPPPA